MNFPVGRHHLVSPKFGWKKQDLEKDPSRWLIHLGVGKDKDVIWSKNRLIPTQKLIHKAYNMLNRTSLETPGFLVIDNIGDFVHTEKGRQRFQNELYQGVNDLFERAIQKESTSSHIRSEHVETREFRQKDGAFKQPCGFMSAAKFTLKRFHHDSHTIIASHIYDKVYGIKGGQFILFDDLQYAKDKNVAGGHTSLYELEQNKHEFPCSPVLKEKYKDRIGDYTFEIDTIPEKGSNGRRQPKLIMFNNLFDGVAHGAREFARMSPHWMRSYARIFSRLSRHGEELIWDKLPFHHPDHHNASRLEASS
jgi:hypothetical protein